MEQQKYILYGITIVLFLSEKTFVFLTKKVLMVHLRFFQGRGFNIILNLESLSRNFIVNFGSFVCSFRVFLVTL